MLNAVARYCSSHWQGKQSLAWSFWINLIAVRVVLFAFQERLSPAKGSDWSGYWWQFVAWALVAHGIVLVWQIVGVLRSAERHQKNTGSIAASWGAQLALVPVIFLSGTYLLQAWQQARPLPDKENYLLKMERERAMNYKIRIVPGISAVEFTGTIELGATRKLKGILKSGPPIRLVLLESIGGNIYEARGMARLVHEYGLNTHVSGNCSSACTSVYMAGEHRTMTDKARLGFHQYRFDVSYKILNVDPRKEQERDLALYENQGVTAGFLAKVFEKPSSSMWYPPQQELLDANVVHEIIRTQ